MADIAGHFKEKVEPQGFKAMIVVPDRYACVQYKAELDKYFPQVASRVVISTSANDDFEFKQSKLRMYGVIAHELQEVIPYAVFGEKDAEQMQGVDYSKIVPILIKSIQELEARLKTLENK